jgi:hypothetical protein
VLQAEFPVTLWKSDLQTTLVPGFLLFSGRRARVLTPDPDNDATWWQEF